MRLLSLTILLLCLPAACSDGKSAGSGRSSAAIRPGDVRTRGGSGGGPRGEDLLLPSSEQSDPDTGPKSDDEPLWDLQIANRARKNTVSAMGIAIARLKKRRERKAEAVRTRHILIGVIGTPINTQRTPKEAQELAANLFAQVSRGGDFRPLVVRYSDELFKGEVFLNNGKDVRGSQPRKTMPKAYGDCAWRLDVGEIGVVPFDRRKTKYGWYIIERLQ